MKLLTFTYAQYASTNLNWSYLFNCNATGFVFIPPQYPVPSNAASDMATAIKKLIDGRSTRTTDIYIGTPGINSTNFGNNPATSVLTSFLSNVYNLLASSTYRAKVAGAYMNQESIYGTVDYNNLLTGTGPGNVQIKRMNEIRAWIKSGNIGGTTFIWIPYYGSGSDPGTIIKNIGYVADGVQIFDYVMMQPSVFFDQTTTIGNFAGIKYSMDLGKVCYRNGVYVIANKISTTKLGYEMEFDVNKANYSSLYAQYTTAFANYRSYPQAFYWAGYGDAITFNYINSWY